MANHDTWNACQDHGKMFVMVLTQEIISKIRLNHFQLLTVSLVGRPVYECVEAENALVTGNNV